MSASMTIARSIVNPRVVSVGWKLAKNVIAMKAIEEGILRATDVMQRKTDGSYVPQLELTEEAIEKIKKAGSSVAKKLWNKYSKDGFVETTPEDTKAAILGTIDSFEQARIIFELLRELRSCHLRPSIESSAKIYHLHGILDELDVDYSDLYAVVDQAKFYREGY